MEVSVVIPNYNGIAFLDSVLASLEGQTLKNFEVIFVDNGSSDGSCSFVAGNYPWVHIIELPENYGFCRAVNEGIKASRAPYVLLLNNDTEVKEDFLEEMTAAIRRHKKAFPVRPGWFSIMTGIVWMMRETFTMHWAGPLPEARERTFIPTRRKKRYFLPVEERQSIEGRSLNGSVILMKNILPIWKIRTSDIVREYTAMKTGTHRRLLSIMWEAAPVVLDIISSRPDILQGIMSI